MSATGTPSLGPSSTGERVYDVDVVVVGSGVAGMSTALGLVRTRRVLVVEDGDGSTRWAQGGIAVALDSEDPAEHARDTQDAGGGLCDPRALDRLVEEGPLRVADLVAGGARLDRDDQGALTRSLEGGHRRRRVVHAGGDATGAEVWRALHAQAEQAGVQRLRDTRVTALTRVQAPGGPTVTGLLATGPAGPVRVHARAVVLATGGIGHAYGASTNPVGVRGEGLALALLAGGTLRDMEFVQFHPTALAVGDGHRRLPLVSEALRGEGAVLRDLSGQPLMAGVHPLGDLAPRDVVAAAVDRAIRDQGTDHVWLDARRVDDVRRRFPTVTAACDDIGVDPASDLVPVRPAQHFLCGGIATDAWGATDVPGLYAVGEVAATGVHGANRLASNSLLEGLVYGARVAAGLTLQLPGPATGPQVPTADTSLADDPTVAARARALLDRHAGIVRDGSGLDVATSSLRSMTGRDPVWLVASAVIAAAAGRTHSLGCHLRSDTPPWAGPRTRPRTGAAVGRTRVRCDANGVPTAGAPLGDADLVPAGSAA